MKEEELLPSLREGEEGEGSGVGGVGKGGAFDLPSDSVKTTERQRHTRPVKALMETKRKERYKM